MRVLSGGLRHVFCVFAEGLLDKTTDLHPPGWVAVKELKLSSHDNYGYIEFGVQFLLVRVSGYHNMGKK